MHKIAWFCTQNFKNFQGVITPDSQCSRGWQFNACVSEAEPHWHFLATGLFPIRLLYSIWRYLVSFARQSKFLVENRNIFIPHLYLVPPKGWPVGILRKCLIFIKLQSGLITTEWLKLKYPNGQNAISRQPCQIFIPNFLVYMEEILLQIWN